MKLKLKVHHFETLNEIQHESQEVLHTLQGQGFGEPSKSEKSAGSGIQQFKGTTWSEIVPCKLNALLYIGPVWEVFNSTSVASRPSQPKINTASDSVQLAQLNRHNVFVLKLRWCIALNKYLVSTLKTKIQSQCCCSNPERTIIFWLCLIKKIGQTKDPLWLCAPVLDTSLGKRCIKEESFAVSNTQHYISRKELQRSIKT